MSGVNPSPLTSLIRWLGAGSTGQVLPARRHGATLGFGLWTSPSNTAYIDVVCHFIDVNKQLRTLLLAVRHIQGDHSGKNQAKSILPVLQEYDFVILQVDLLSRRSAVGGGFAA